MIEGNQRQLGDTIKDLTKEAKDVMVAFYLQTSELVTTMKIMMMAMCNSSQKDSALEQ